MSIVDSLIRLFSPVEYAERIVQRRKKLVAPRTTPDRDPPKLQCTLCGFEGTDRFCLRCLAPTMRPTPRR